LLNRYAVGFMFDNIDIQIQGRDDLVNVKYSTFLLFLKKNYILFIFIYSN